MSMNCSLNINIHRILDENGKGQTALDVAKASMNDEAAAILFHYQTLLLTKVDEPHDRTVSLFHQRRMFIWVQRKRFHATLAMRLKRFEDDDMPSQT